jgi:putative phage-type endonuclease
MQFTAEQILERRKGIGGSDAPSIFGFGYLSPLELWFRKAGLVDDTSEQNEAMEWGTVLEDPIAKIWAARQKRTIKKAPVMQWSKDYPHAYVSIDRHIVALDERGPGVLECKNFNEYYARQIGLDEENLESVPLGVRIQLLHGMAVRGWQWGSIAILVGGNRLLSWDMDRDQDAIAALMKAEASFMESVKNDTPPQPDWQAGDVLNLVYNKADGEKIVVTDENIKAVATQLLSLREIVKTNEKELDQRKNCIKMLMGNASICEVSGVGEFSWLRTKDKTEKVFQEAKFKDAHPKLHAEFLEKVTKPGHRVFRCKDQGGGDA